MTIFKNTKDKNVYFDSLVELYKSNDFEGFERGVTYLSANDRKKFLIYIFGNKDKYKDFNHDIMFRLTLDNL